MRFLLLSFICFVSLVTLNSCCCSDEVKSGFDKGFNYGWFAQMGDNYREEGNYEKAIESYEKAITFDSDDPSAYKGLGEAYLSLGEKAESDNDFQKALDNYNLSVENYEKALEKAPEDGDIQTKLQNAKDLVKITSEKVS
ncbi:MAG: tetratricopeptide repeat protein [Cyanobacteriota bacterium]